MLHHRFIAASVAVLSVAGAVAVPTTVSAESTSSQIRSASSAQLYGNGPFTAPASEAARAADALASTDPAGARAAATIAEQPVATWLGDWTTGAALTRTLDQATAGAAVSGTTAVFVTYAIPDRDCGGYSAGGFDEASYNAWVDQIAARLAGKHAAVVVEPDSLAMLSNTACTRVLDQQRFRILAREVAAFTAAGVPAYLDAGNSNWVQPAVIASRLERAGVQNARGFATNVSNYYPTVQEQAYAERVSALTDGSHYVIDSSRNGQGWRGTWCNAPGAGLGTTPRVVADGTALDALLWVKTPGASDGTCGGGPSAGTWYPAYARALVANARLGVPAAARSPIGTLDAAVGSAGAVRATGRVFDAGATGAPLVVAVVVDGVRSATGVADRPRRDVVDAHGTGTEHGYDVTTEAAPGAHTVCVVALDVGPGADAQLGCADVRVLTHDPVVGIDRAVASAGGITVRGSAFDGDDLDHPVTVSLRVDGITVRSVVASRSRPDSADTTGGGSAQGFEAVVPAGAGRHTVCARATNSGAGRDVTGKCVALQVAASPPSGAFEGTVSSRHRRVTVSGWAFDREDTSASVLLTVTVAGRAAGPVRADGLRADVDGRYGSGAVHGFSATVVAVTGRRSVCVTARGIGRGGDRALGCRTVTVR